MPLCTVALRSLAYRQAFTIRSWQPQSLTRWRLSQHHIRSYNTASHQSQEDDSIPLPSELPSSDAVTRQSLESPAEENAGATQLKKQPAIRRTLTKPRRRRRHLEISSSQRTRLKKHTLASTERPSWRRATVRLQQSTSIKRLGTPSPRLVPSTQRVTLERASYRVRQFERRRLESFARRWKGSPRLGQQALRQTVARFRGPEGLSTRQATRGRIWSTANPYTLTKIFPFTASPEPTSARWTSWERQYRYIAWYYATFRRRLPGEQPGYPRLMPEVDGWVEIVLEKLDSGQKVITAEDMGCKDTDELRQRWEQVALYILAYNPKRMIEFLLATNAQQDLQTHVFEDSLLQLARYFKHHRDAPRAQQLVDAFCHMVEERPDRPLTFLNEFTRVLLKYSSEERRKRLFAVLKTHQVKLHPYSWLHFSSRFAKTNQFEAAVEALLLAHYTGARLDSYAFRSCCTTILRKSSEQPDSLRLCLRLVSTLVDIGVTFNLPICNVIMLNTIEAGDLKTAFSVYHSLMERGLKPDEITFLVLLKGCRLNINDAQLLDEIIRDAIGHINVRQSPKVATAILHTLALHHSQHNPKTALITLTEAYAQFFDLEPLKKIGLTIRPSIRSRPSTEAKPMPPTRHALTFILGATITHYLHTAPTPAAQTRQILDIYTRWRTHVENTNGNADPSLAALASTDHLPNLFLSAFTKNSKTLLLAARVVRDLQRPLPPTAITTQTKPTVQTWSIFLQGFTQHGQMQLAEQVLTYMRKQGIEPNTVTWNSLVKGYANAQDVGNVAEVLREMEMGGLVWDVWTHKGLRNLRGREGLEERMRRLRVVEQLDFSGELKVGLGERFGEGQGDGRVEGDRMALEKGSGLIDDSGLRPRVPIAEVEREGFGDSPGEIAEQEAAYQPFGGA